MTQIAAITGHTKGIGLAISNYLSNNYIVKGYSKSNGYDIAKEEDRQKIFSDAEASYIFVNNAYNNFDDSQLRLLEIFYNNWLDKDKIIINISTRFTNSDHAYSRSKHKIDLFCDERVFNKLPYLINLKPGLTDTVRVQSIMGDRIDVNDIVNVLDYILGIKDLLRVTSITFGK